MRTVFHKSLTQEIWKEKPIDYQILTICAEFGRAKSSLKRHQIQEVKNSMERALELLDLIKSDPEWRTRLRELVRFRELTAEFYWNQPENLNLCLQLYKCFLQFHPETSDIRI